MKGFNKHHFAALCRLQLKEITVFEWIAPFFVMMLMLIMVNIGTDCPEEWMEGIESQVSIYFNLGVLGICSELFIRFFKYKNAVCKLMLPATAMEKWISIWAVVLLQLLYWFVIGFLADAIMLLVGTQVHDFTFSRILDEYLQLYMDPRMYLFYCILATGTSFVVTAANTVWGQEKMFHFTMAIFALFFAADYWLPEEVMPIVLAVAALVLLVSGYFIFRKTIMNRKKL